MLFLMFSPTICYAVEAYVPTITSVTPNTWIAGQSTNVTFTGTGFTDQGTRNCYFAGVGFDITIEIGSMPEVAVNIVSDTEATATVTPDANDPTQTACQYVGETIVGVVRAPVSAAHATTPATITPKSCIASGSIPVQILGNQIMWSQATTPGNVISVIDDGSGTPPPTQSAVVGQQIHMTTSDIPKNITVTKRTWTVDGTRIKNYVVTPNKSARVTELKDDDLQNKDKITYYWVYPNDPSDPNANFPVTYEYCVDIPDVGNQCSTAMAAFNVSGPSDVIKPELSLPDAIGIWEVTGPTSSCSTQWLFFGLASSNGPDRPGLIDIPGIFFDGTNVSNIPDSGGNFFWVQIVDSVVVSGTEPGVKLIPSRQGPGLDNTYPYVPVPNNPLVELDAPAQGLDNELTSKSESFKATMYMMWQSTTEDSIPVPIGYVDWTIQGTAHQNAK